MKLEGKRQLLSEIKRIEREVKMVTLLYAAEDRERNNWVILKTMCETVV